MRKELTVIDGHGTERFVRRGGPLHTAFAALLLSVFLHAAFSCSSIDCPVQNLVYTNYDLYKSTGVVDTLHDTLYVFSMRTDGTDTTLFNRGINVTSFSLPIGSANPEDTLFFVRVGADNVFLIDTVCIKKENYPHFESVDCSASFFHKITAVRSTRNGIDSIVINHADVNYDTSQKHYRIYFKNRD